MNLPPSSAPPVPAGYGVAIPHSPNDLLAFIKSQQKQKKKSSASSSAISINGSGLGALDRQKKLEEEHEGYERKLMELEDFYFTQEGSARIRRAEDRLLMYVPLAFTRL